MELNNSFRDREDAVNSTGAADETATVGELISDYCGYVATTASAKFNALQPFQLQQLEALESWETFGVEGPYNWSLTFAYLETWLEEHDGKPPPIEILRGGYIGLDATLMERLSGALTVINQNDAKQRKLKNGKKLSAAVLGLSSRSNGFTVRQDKQEDLDRLCKRFALRWRKERGSDGCLLSNSRGQYVGKRTFIQLAHQRFKALYRKTVDTKTKSEYLDTHFPQYSPEAIKYRYQENPSVFKQKLMPRKWKAVRYS